MDDVHNLLIFSSEALKIDPLKRIRFLADVEKGLPSIFSLQIYSLSAARLANSSRSASLHDAVHFTNCSYVL